MKHLNCHNKFLFTNPFAYQANLLVGSAKRNFPQAALYQTKIFRARMLKCRSATYYFPKLYELTHIIYRVKLWKMPIFSEFFFPKLHFILQQSVQKNVHTCKSETIFLPSCNYQTKIWKVRRLKCQIIG